MPAPHPSLGPPQRESRPGRAASSRLADLRPLLWIAAGLVVVALDIRTPRLDLLPDPVGWLAVALGAHRLPTPIAAWAASATAFLSLAGVHLADRFVRVDPLTGEVLDGPAAGRVVEQLVFGDLVGWPLILTLAADAAAAVTVLVLFRAAADRRAPPANSCRLLPVRAA